MSLIGCSRPGRNFGCIFELTMRTSDLTPSGRRLGLVGDDRWARFTLKQEQRLRISALLESTRANAVVDYIGLDSSNDNPELKFVAAPARKLA